MVSHSPPLARKRPGGRLGPAMADAPSKLRGWQSGEAARVRCPSLSLFLSPSNINTSPKK